MNIDRFNAIPDGEVIAKGEIENSPDGIFMTDTREGDLLKWVAKKGYGNDWGIYIHWAESGYDFVIANGDKVNAEANIKKLVPCTDELFELYRY